MSTERNRGVPLQELAVSAIRVPPGLCQALRAPLAAAAAALSGSAAAVASSLHFGRASSGGGGGCCGLSATAAAALLRGGGPVQVGCLPAMTAEPGLQKTPLASQGAD